MRRCEDAHFDTLAILKGEECAVNEATALLVDEAKSAIVPGSWMEWEPYLEPCLARALCGLPQPVTSVAEVCMIHSCAGIA